MTSPLNMVQSWSLSDQIGFSLNEQNNFIVQAASINTELKENIDMLWLKNSPAIHQEQHLHAKPARNMGVTLK
jgi:hypothetical protein